MCLQRVVQALDLAADAVEELSRGSEANQEVLDQHCKSFLDAVKVCTESPVVHSLHVTCTAIPSQESSIR